MKMQYMKSAACLFLWAGLSVACSQEAVNENLLPQSNSGEEVVFKTAIARTRTQTTGTQTVFSDADKMGVFGTVRATSEMLHKNLEYSYDAGMWTADRSITFPLDGSEVNFYAYYPYTEGCETLNFEFSVDADQSADGYNRSDLLLAKNETCSVNSTTVGLSFVHALAMVELRIEMPDGVNCVKAEIKACRTAKVDLKKQTASLKPDDEPVFVTMQPIENDNNVFRAILPMQALSAGKCIRLTGDNGACYWYTTSEMTVLLRNEITTFTICL